MTALVLDDDWVVFDGWNVPHPNEIVMVLGRFGNEWGPVPFELIKPEAWNGCCMCAGHDLIAYRVVQS